MVIILRGISGAGKSTWAKKYVEGNPDLEVRILSADHFFELPDGTYNFDPKNLSHAHSYCLGNYLEAVRKLGNKSARIVVDNTNTSVVEIAPYVALAQLFQHEVYIYTIFADPQLCSSRNVHGVSPKKVHEQYNRLVEEQKRFPPWWKHEVLEQEWKHEAKEPLSSR